MWEERNKGNIVRRGRNCISSVLECVGNDE